MAICIGDQFASYDSFRAKVQEIERNTDCMFVIESSKTVESANKLVKDGRKLYDPVFKYRFVKLGCKHYGKSRTSTKSHEILRPNQSGVSFSFNLVITFHCNSDIINLLTWN